MNVRGILAMSRLREIHLTRARSRAEKAAALPNPIEKFTEQAQPGHLRPRDESARYSRTRARDLGLIEIPTLRRQFRLRVKALAVGRYPCIAVYHAGILLLYSAPEKAFFIKKLFNVRNSYITL
jgi:hypothetical protein